MLAEGQEEERDYKKLCSANRLREIDEERCRDKYEEKPGKIFYNKCFESG